jgi:putative hydrolase of HD superfamily
MKDTDMVPPISPVRESGAMANFAYEVGMMRHLPREFKLAGFLNPVSVVEHIFRVAMMAWFIAEREGADVARTVQLALAHDLPEARTTDHGLVASRYVVENEEKAASDMLKDRLPSAYEAWKEYEHRESLESKIVKDADHIDILLESCENAAHGFQFPKSWESEFDFRRSRLTTETARQMFDDIRKTHPLAWYDTFTQKMCEDIAKHGTHKLKVVA